MRPADRLDRPGHDARNRDLGRGVARPSRRAGGSSSGTSTTGPFFTLRVGGGFLVDYATYAQDDASKEQMDLEPGFKIRDSRLLISGRIKTKRRITYQAGFMYDGYRRRMVRPPDGVDDGGPGGLGKLLDRPQQGRA